MAAITIMFIFLMISTFANSESNLSQSDVNLIEFPLNIEYLEAEYFLFGATGKGLDSIDNSLSVGGPPPAGARKANLTFNIRSVIAHLANQEIGHLRAIKKTVQGFPRPLLNLSSGAFATMINNAFEKPLSPPFDPYANDINYLISCYIIPYVGLTGYVGTNPKLQSPGSLKLIAGLLGSESGQDAIIRSLLYERAHEKVTPYNITVAEFTKKISKLRNQLGHEGIKDKGIFAPSDYGTEDDAMPAYILAGDNDSLSYGRTPEEILRIIYGSGNERVPGGFYPDGANGMIAKGYL
ncbi:hypothetical protein Tco_0285544 [Tanacetum coccineum]